MNALAPVAPRLSKLLPVLASDRDGEVVATARAIDRTLKSAGLSWHDLAAVLVVPTAPPDPPRQNMADDIDDGPPPLDDVRGWRFLARSALDFRSRMSNREIDFCKNMAGADRPLTQKQADWLWKIWTRHYA